MEDFGGDGVAEAFAGAVVEHGFDLANSLPGDALASLIPIMNKAWDKEDALLRWYSRSCHTDADNLDRPKIVPLRDTAPVADFWRTLSRCRT